MPKILDVGLVSLSEESNSQASLFNQEAVFSSSNSDQFLANEFNWFCNLV